MTTKRIDAGKTPVRRSPRKATPARPDKRQSAVLPLPERVCQCGCGETYTPSRRNQKYIGGHRWAAYAMHRCETCGTLHRQGKQYAQ